MNVRLIKGWRHIKKGIILLVTKEKSEELIKDGFCIEYEGTVPVGQNADEYEARAAADYNKMLKKQNKKAIKEEKKTKEEIKEKAKGNKFIGE